MIALRSDGFFMLLPRLKDSIIIMENGVRRCDRRNPVVIPNEPKN